MSNLIISEKLRDDIRSVLLLGDKICKKLKPIIKYYEDTYSNNTDWDTNVLGVEVDPEYFIYYDLMEIKRMIEEVENE